MHIRSFSFAAVPVLLMTAQAQAGPSKEIRDYVAWCTNGLTCKAETFAKDEELGGLGLERRAGRDTPVELFFRMPEAFSEGSIVRVGVDGKPAAALKAAEFARDEDDGANRLTSPVAVGALIEAARNGDTLEIAYAAGKGERKVAISLAGLAGSLTWLDDKQGRIGAKDAIVAKGDKDSPQFVPRDLLSIDDLPEDLKNEFAENAQCALMEPERFGLFGGFEDQFDAVNSLLVMPCGEGGAYNQPYAVYWVTDLGERPMALPAMGELGPIVVEEVWNMDWDHTTRELTGFFKGRGLGDCGMFDKWRLTGEDEFRTFTLIESRQKDNCDGEGGLETFPIVWPVKRK